MNNRSLTTPYNNSGSPSEAMLQMLRKHKEDVHRIASLAAEISVATETSTAINTLGSSRSSNGRASPGRRGMPYGSQSGVSGGPIQDQRLFNGNRTAPISGTSSPSTFRSPSSPNRGLKSESFGPASIRTTASPLNKSTNQHRSGGAKGGNYSGRLSSGGTSSPYATKEVDRGIMTTTTRTSTIKGSSSSKQSPEEKQHRMRQSVDNLYQTVQDQRTRAEARGLTLARAL